MGGWFQWKLTLSCKIVNIIIVVVFVVACVWNNWSLNINGHKMLGWCCGIGNLHMIFIYQTPWSKGNFFFNSILFQGLCKNITGKFPGRQLPPIASLWFQPPMSSFNTPSRLLRPERESGVVKPSSAAFRGKQRRASHWPSPVTHCDDSR